MTDVKFEQEYLRRLPNFERLAMNIQQAIRGFLEQEHIDVLDVSYRIKSFTSFREKIIRKGYLDPFNDIQDVCGIRIITFFPSDLRRITDIINRAFEVLESVNREETLEPDRFGYRSNHYIIQLRSEWLAAPNYRGLGGVVAELQVRTVLMHAWADLSHRLSYKERDQTPVQFQRKVFQLSALFELADQELNRLREEKERLQYDVREQVQSAEIINDPLNVDALQAFLDVNFPDRQRSESATAELVNELNRYGVSLADIFNGFNTTRPIISESEELAFPEGIKWAQVGILRHILDLTLDRYWVSRRGTMPQDVADRTELLRNRLRK